MLKRITRIRSLDDAANEMRVALAKSSAYRRLNRAVYDAQTWKDEMLRGQRRKASAKVAFMITSATREQLIALGYDTHRIKSMKPDQALAAAERQVPPVRWEELVRSLEEEARQKPVGGQGGPPAAVRGPAETAMQSAATAVAEAERRSRGNAVALADAAPLRAGAAAEPAAAASGGTAGAEESGAAGVAVGPRGVGGAAGALVPAREAAREASRESCD